MPETSKADEGTPHEKRQPSELEQGVEQLGRVVGGVMTRLLGAGITGHTAAPERSILGEEGDRTVDQVGETVGRFLKAAGESLKAHPTDPIQVVGETIKHGRDPVEPRPGEAPLTEGIRSLAGGIYKTTEAILDIVAPRRPKTEGPSEETEDAPSDEPKGQE